MRIFLVSVFAFGANISLPTMSLAEPAIIMDYAHVCSLHIGTDEADALKQVLTQMRAETPKWKDDWNLHVQVKELEYAKVAECLVQTNHWKS